MTQQTKSLADLLPSQGHYYLLHDGVKFARHGTPEAIGLLVFEDRERADQFCLTVGKALPAFKPVRVDAEEFMRLVEEVGAVCVVDGLLEVVVATLRPQRSRPGTQTGSDPSPANPERVVPGNSHWVPADQIPAVVEAQLDDDVLPCGCPVDPLEIEDARASRIEEARVAACDDRDDVCEILEGGQTDSENASPATSEFSANVDDESWKYGKINLREVVAELDAPNEIDELFRAADDLEHLGLVADAERIRESISDLVWQMRRNWLMNSNYIPWGSDEEWVQSCNAIPDEMEDHPVLVDGLKALLRDVECVRQRAKTTPGQDAGV